MVNSFSSGTGILNPGDGAYPNVSPYLIGDINADGFFTSAGDSSGAVFVNSYGTWKLAGINYSIEGPFSTTAGGTKFLGAIFDKGGLYYNSSKIYDGAADAPESFYATRVSAHASWRWVSR